MIWQGKNRYLIPQFLSKAKALERLKGFPKLNCKPLVFNFLNEKWKNYPRSKIFRPSMI